MNRQRSGRLFSRLRQDRRGAVAIEFAFIAPILFGIILGTIDLGRYAWTLSTIQNAADEAARIGAVQNKNASQVETIAQNNLFSQDVGDFTVAATFPVIGGANFLQVQVTHTYDFMFPISIYQATGSMDVISRFPKP
jgi:Flp pilus assembly protein TadG